MPNLNLFENDQQRFGTFVTVDYRLQSAITQISTRDKIWSFTELPVGWHYGKGVPTSKTAARAANAFNNYAFQLGFAATNAFPGARGNIMLTAYQGEHIVELTISAEGQTANLLHKKNDEEVSYIENVTLAVAAKAFKTASALCCLSERSTKNITIISNEDLAAWPSRNLMTEYLFSRQSAPSSVPEAYARTSTSFMFQSASLPFQPFTGPSTTPHYLLAQATKRA